MPVLKIKTVESKVGWTNPDNADMVSHDLVIDVNGRKAQARTYSKAIAEVGFEGEVETYEKKDHTYLKQVQKEGSQWAGKRSFGNKPAYKDNSDGQRQGMCINNASAYINNNDKNDNLTPLEWAKLVWEYANELYKLGDLKSDDKEKLDTGTLDEIHEVPDDGRISLDDIEGIFGKEDK